MANLAPSTAAPSALPLSPSAQQLTLVPPPTHPHTLTYPPPPNAFPVGYEEGGLLTDAVSHYHITGDESDVTHCAVAGYHTPSFAWGPRGRGDGGKGGGQGVPPCE